MVFFTSSNKQIILLSSAIQTWVTDTYYVNTLGIGRGT